MGVIRTHQAVVQADGGQCYLRSGDAWRSDRVGWLGYERHLWSSGGFVYLGTARPYADVTLTVEVLDGPPAAPGDQWDHVASTSLESDGRLELLSCDPPGQGGSDAIDLGAGTWRLRVLWSDVARAEEAYDEDEPAEALTLQLWPAAWSETEVERWWGPWQLPAPSDVSPDGLRQIEGYESFVDRLQEMERIGGFGSPFPPLPREDGSTSVYALFWDRSDGSWWVHACTVRAILREITADDAASLRILPSFVPGG